MDVRTGRIHSAVMLGMIAMADRKFMRPMEVDPTPEQIKTGFVGRNDPCPCASGKKFKKCCRLKGG